MRLGAVGRFGMSALKRSSAGWSDYMLRVTAPVIARAGVGGDIAASFLCDPSFLPLSEWSTFAGLFDEVKVVRFSVALTPQDNLATVANYQIPLYIGSFVNTTSVPTSAPEVANASDSALVCANLVKPYVHKMKVPPDLLFASTGSPGGLPSAGCPGAIRIFGAGGAASVSSYLGLIVAHYHLRGRT